MSVHKDKSNGTWYVKYKNNTKRGFKNKKTAENFEAELITGLKEPKKRKLIKLSTVALDYLKNKKNELQYSSYKI